jgi:hypothetical protein
LYVCLTQHHLMIPLIYQNKLNEYTTHTEMIWPECR